MTSSETTVIIRRDPSPPIQGNEFVAFLSQERISFTQNASLASLTTIGIGGRVAFWVRPTHEEQLLALAAMTQRLEIPIWIHGQGSNTLFHLPSDPYPGILISWTGDTPCEWPLTPKPILENLHSGTKKSHLASYLIRHALSPGIWMQGIPGTLAGGIIMNAGTRMGTFSQLVTSVTWVDLKTQTLHTQTVTPSDFGYRIQSLWGPLQLITRCTLALPPPKDKNLFLQTLSDARTYRAQTQPLQEKNFGSTFVNPPGHHAAALLTESGLKGTRRGDAMISPKHANFFVNVGHATSDNMIALIDHAIACVHRDHGVQLAPEVKVVTRFVL